MPRIKIDLPENLHFVCSLPVRITDLNYGGHVGNDRIVALVHEARVQFLKRLGYGELEIESVGLIMSDLAVSFQAELFYGDTVNVYMKAADFTRVGFDFYYRLSKTSNEKEITVATAKTGMVCFDYMNKKPVGLPETVKIKLVTGF
jgi:acyl-CoA thioester hydrolase